MYWCMLTNQFTVLTTQPDLLRVYGACRSNAVPNIYTPIVPGSFRDKKMEYSAVDVSAATSLQRLALSVDDDVLVGISASVALDQSKSPLYHDTTSPLFSDRHVPMSELRPDTPMIVLVGLLSTAFSWRSTKGPLQAILVKHNIFYYVCGLFLSAVNILVPALFPNVRKPPGTIVLSPVRAPDRAHSGTVGMLHSALTLTQTAAIELGHNGITVNAYAPGTIQTPMLARLAGSADYNDIYDELKRLSSVGDLGSTQDIANLVSFLVTPEARFITGQTITIDGGIFFD
ncbi:uncharacterized protein HD556DRAFT_1314234 [Suillus plorans]|uniref:Uncharacterized protein n=1 Tax=Suillus plorans TaxID=116603 RepID=A0A9P7AAJ5_9AGAM|nr:uncharacterized protein HD556DRAFT_1314234 [Suillus plorans]KAG1785453.1 hypothetical protein HD556DRAFT_1314234 [Suillus plorans]